MNFMSIYANIYNSTRVISKIFLFYLSIDKYITNHLYYPKILNRIIENKYAIIITKFLFVLPNFLCLK